MGNDAACCFIIIIIIIIIIMILLLLSFDEVIVHRPSLTSLMAALHPRAGLHARPPAYPIPPFGSPQVLLTCNSCGLAANQEKVREGGGVDGAGRSRWSCG